MVAMGEICLGAFLQVVFDKLASCEMFNFFRRELIHTQVRNWRRTLQEIRAVLDDAEEKQITNNLVNLWLEELQDLAYDLDHLLDEFSTEALRYDLIEKSQSSTNKIWALIPTFMRPNPGDAIFDSKKSKVNEITTKLQTMSKQISTLGLHVVNISKMPIQDQERQSTTSKTYETCIYGRDKSKREIINLLLMEELNLGIIPITGMGGIGKTTLAQLVYNDEVVKKHFDLKAWICVSDNFNIMRITKEIAEYIHVDFSGSKTLDQLQDQLKRTLAGKKFLIVLDDVWDIKYNEWNILKIPFSDGGTGCKVIVTTRVMYVASMMSTIQYCVLECLPYEECWFIFAQHAFRNISMNTNPNLVSIGHEIVKKCGGLPLAARTLGSLLQCKPTEIEWKNVLNSSIWDLKESDILPALRLSYHDLPPHLKQCFAYCSILPKDYEFEEKELVLLWMAEGFICQQGGGKNMEDIGGEYFRELVSRSFFHQSCMTEGSKFVMHDLINDLAQFVARQTCFRLEDKNQEQYKNLKKVRHSSYTQGYSDGIKKIENFYTAKHLQTFVPSSFTKLSSCKLSSHFLLAWSDPELPLELRSDAMPRKIDMKNLAQMAREGRAPMATTPTAKGIVIGVKRPRDEIPDISPSKKGKSIADSKGKGSMPPPKDKKNESTTKASPKSKVLPSWAMPTAMPTSAIPSEGTSSNPGVALGPNVSILENPEVAETLLQDLIMPVDKEVVEKLNLDWVITMLFQSIGQAVVFSSSLADRSKKMREEAMTQQAQVDLVGDKMARAQKVVKELEGRVAELEAEKQCANEELKRLKERDANVEWLEKEVAELKKKEALARTSAVENYKASDAFHEAVERLSSKYYGEGFDLCKKQIGHLHPSLNIQEIQIDPEMVEQEEEEEEEEEKDKDKDELVNSPPRQ